MIDLDHVTKRYDGAAVVDDVSLSVPSGAFCVLIGASGSGKSTLLRMINRLIEPSSGTIRFDGADVATIPEPALRRRIGYAIQSGGLFPHWTIARNIATVPRLLRWPEPRIEARIAELMALVELDPAIGARYPHQLSGGQQQRVGVARALAADPDALLMDEPFGALDPLTRASLQASLARIQRATGKTVVMVTHDMAEALLLASMIAVVERGRIAQCDTPAAILNAPASDYVRRLVGEGDRGIKLLSVTTVADRMRAGETAPGTPVSPDITLREALSLMVERRCAALPVAGPDGKLGTVRIEDLVAARAA